jgi:hypothetical protein
MTKTVVGILDSYQEAELVIRDLLDSGFKQDEISFAARESEEPLPRGVSPDQSIGVEPYKVERAAAGATLGGVTGLVIGLITVAIPGIGPLAAAGPVGTALAGGGIGFAAGGIIGFLTGAGVSEEEAGYYVEAVRRGGVLVMVRAEEEMAGRAADIMNRHGAVDIGRRVEDWRQSGWSGFDERAEPYTLDRPAAREATGTDQLEAENRRHLQSNYPGEDYEAFRSAYAFGAEIGEAGRYRGRSWLEIEDQVREEWHCNNPGPWERYKAAIHHGWERRAKIHEEA